MKVYGVEITAEQIAAADAIIFSGKLFTCFDVVMALDKAGVKDGLIVYRAADRILQNHKKSGAIAYSPKLGKWVATHQCNERKAGVSEK